jgi:glutaminase
MIRVNGRMNKYVQEGYNYGIDYCQQGKVADYIPELAKGKKEQLGICITDLEGNQYFTGDVQVKFTIQSIAKVVILATAIADSGFETVFSRVGMEPTGDPFNSIVRLESLKRIPQNPMINAGAISTITCVTGKNLEERFLKVLNLARKLFHNPELDYDANVYLSELGTANRNRALAYMMKSNGVFDGDVEEHLKVYFKCCSILATCKEISYFGAVLANKGVCPITKEMLIEPLTVKVLRSLMGTCGMYDASGEFALKVGIPSKSGVGGGIVSAVPQKMGIGVFGPALDARGNSIAGIKALEYIGKELDLNIF